MSEYERHSGVAVCTDINVEDYILKYKDKIPSYYSEEDLKDPHQQRDCLWDMLGNTVLIINGIIWELDNTEHDTNYDFCDIKKLPSGHMEYHTSFYNGGASLSEVLEEGIRRLNE